MFIGVSERQEEQGNTRALKEKRKLEEELFGYREWIRTASMLLPLLSSSLRFPSSDIYMCYGIRTYLKLTMHVHAIVIGLYNEAKRSFCITIDSTAYIIYDITYILSFFRGFNMS